MKLKILLDMDGVIADLDSVMLENYGLTHEDGNSLDKNRRSLYRSSLATMVDEIGFDSFPVLPFARELALFAANFDKAADFAICTSTGNFHPNRSLIMKQKMDFLRKNFCGTLDELPIIFTNSGRQKAKLAAPGVILVDDTEWNIRHFNEAGGMGIRYEPEKCEHVIATLRHAITYSAAN